MVERTAGLEEISPERCRELLRLERVGRVGVTLQALPAIFPVNYLLRDQGIVIRTIAGTKLNIAMRRAVVAFEVDRHDPQGRWGWSVLVRGVAGTVEDAEELARLDATGLRTWAHVPGTELHWMRIETSVISGRSFGHPLPGADHEALAPVRPATARRA
jgi:nitroimidazol reductase NimA-like FMN-containing flavoprotein (pyridoxamine 5'-phosphate oxidase superfamily)